MPTRSPPTLLNECRGRPLTLDSLGDSRAGEFARYFLASLAALAIDMAVLLALATVMHYLVAASLGFVVGAVTSYLLATRWVFRQRRLLLRKNTEMGLYVLVGVLGLGLNDLVIMLAVGYLGLSIVLAKLLAAGVTFLFNFALRKLALFS
jgi:putative flippase GtrA